MSGLFVGILCIIRRGFLFRSLDSPTSPGSNSVTTNYEYHRSSTSSMIEQRSIRSRGYKDEKLGEIAREAKERLDQKLRRRTMSKERSVKDVENGQVVESSTLQKNSEIIGWKKNGIKTFSRVKQWNDSEKDECIICLDTFKVGDNLMHLQCDHKFHSWCLVPWFENYAYCPCCRVEIVP